MPQEKHLLIVDDEPSIQDFVKRNLELRGFKVSLAANGLEALALFERTHFALIILDIMMPRMDGLEVCRRIRQRSTVPIIVLTALGEEADKIAALDQGNTCTTERCIPSGDGSMNPSAYHEDIKFMICQLFKIAFHLMANASRCQPNGLTQRLGIKLKTRTNTVL